MDSDFVGYQKYGSSCLLWEPNPYYGQSIDGDPSVDFRSQLAKAAKLMQGFYVLAALSLPFYNLTPADTTSDQANVLELGVTPDDLAAGVFEYNDSLLLPPDGIGCPVVDSAAGLMEWLQTLPYPNPELVAFYPVNTDPTSPASGWEVKEVNSEEAIKALFEEIEANWAANTKQVRPDAQHAPFIVAFDEDKYSDMDETIIHAFLDFAIIHANDQEKLTMDLIYSFLRDLETKFQIPIDFKVISIEGANACDPDFKGLTAPVITNENSIGDITGTTSAESPNLAAGQGWTNGGITDGNAHLSYEAVFPQYRDDPILLFYIWSWQHHESFNPEKLPAGSWVKGYLVALPGSAEQTEALAKAKDLAGQIGSTYEKGIQESAQQLWLQEASVKLSKPYPDPALVLEIVGEGTEVSVVAEQAAALPTADQLAIAQPGVEQSPIDGQSTGLTGKTDAQLRQEALDAALAAQLASTAGSTTGDPADKPASAGSQLTTTQVAGSAYSGTDNGTKPAGGTDSSLLVFPAAVVALGLAGLAVAANSGPKSGNTTSSSHDSEGENHSHGRPPTAANRAVVQGHHQETTTNTPLTGPTTVRPSKERKKEARKPDAKGPNGESYYYAGEQIMSGTGAGNVVVSVYSRNGKLGNAGDPILPVRVEACYFEGNPNPPNFVTVGSPEGWIHPVPAPDDMHSGNRIGITTGADSNPINPDKSKKVKDMRAAGGETADNEPIKHTAAHDKLFNEGALKPLHDAAKVEGADKKLDRLAEQMNKKPESLAWPAATGSTRKQSLTGSGLELVIRMLDGIFDPTRD